MKRVLVLEGRYFPKASANTICMQNVLDSLEKNLYEVDIICYKDGLENENKNVYKISRGLIQSLLYSKNFTVADNGQAIFIKSIIPFERSNIYFARVIVSRKTT